MYVRFAVVNLGISRKVVSRESGHFAQSRFTRTVSKKLEFTQCHAERGATKGGVSKREQTQTNADTQANAEVKTQANASKR